MWLVFQMITLGVVSLCVCSLLTVLAKTGLTLHGATDHIRAVQASHSRPTPRLGGIGVFAALLVSLAFTPADIREHYLNILMATGVLFCVGLAEDLHFGVSPRFRLITALIASLLVIVLLDAWMPRSGIPWLDTVQERWYVGVPVTLAVTAAIANGFNLIDGVNGLAGLTSVVAACSLAYIAASADYTLMENLALMLAASILGFLIINYPFGRIFLGDAGAYTIGFILSWFAISILLNVPAASPWALLLTMFWPVADTVLAIWRRARRKAPAMAPDRLHVHQLVMRMLEIHVLGRGKRQIANPLTTFVLAPFIVTPPIFGVLFWNKNLHAFIAVLSFSVLFFGCYALAFPILKRLPKRSNIVSAIRTNGVAAAPMLDTVVCDD